MPGLDTLEVPDIPEVKYEYLDHTADVQLHSWGNNQTEAFEQIAMAMFNYMTTNYDSVDTSQRFEIEADGQFLHSFFLRFCVLGHDMMSLLFHFLDEWLFAFSADPFFIPRIVKITEFDKEKFHIKSSGWGEPFDISKHPQI
ncbi:unnamed protein product [Schistosoma bovis]|nr:unnamed protein product [Schistosoma bovis]